MEDTARGFMITTDGISVALRISWASHEPHDSTLIRVEGSGGIGTLRCTFGFSPNREPGSLLLTRAGKIELVPVAEEEIGREYHRQLDELAALLADPGSRGRAINEVHRTIGVIERFYASARRPLAGRRSPSDGGEG